MASSASGASGAQSVTESTQSIRGKSDPTWEHCEICVDNEGKKCLKCLYCGKFFKGGGIHRMKKHLAGQKGDVLICAKVPYEVRYRLAENLQLVSGNKKRGNDDRGEENLYGDSVVRFDGDTPDMQELHTPPATRQARGKEIVNPTQMAKKKANENIGSYFAPRTMPGAQPSIRSAFAGKEAIHKADLAVARFFYDCCISFNCTNSIYYQPMLDVVAAIGPGYKGPSYHAIRTKLLYEMKKEVELLVEASRSTWKETGCTIMADGWQDQKNRQLINFLVYCPKGISFVKSVDASDVVKDAQTLCNLFIELVEFAGPSNVVHMVTDNAANYKAAGRLLNEKYPSVFWSPCAAHCLNLILGDIGKMEIVSILAKNASTITKFVYNHAFLLAWLRKRQGWTEIIRPGPTRFATTFIALQSIQQHKHDLQALVTSRDFVDSRYYRDNKAKNFMEIVLDNKFWNDCAIVVQIVSPLIRMLRIVDADERPSLGYVYDGMYRVRKTIKAIFMNKKSLYKPYTRIIKQRWDRQLRQKIHCAAYFLNPAFHYDKHNFCIKPEVQQGWLDVLEAKIKTHKTDFLKQSWLYRDRMESFGNQLAIETAKDMRPDHWWQSFGFSAPLVSQLAIQLLSQTASSSGCERNWSVFERIHTKKRNKLEHQRLNDLVYVHYNLGLKNRALNKRRTLDPIDYESMEKIEFWITEKDETPLLDYDELEKMLYNDLPNPILDLTEGNNQERVDGGAGLNLESFPQEDVNSYSGSLSGQGNTIGLNNTMANDDNDAWLYEP